MRPQDRLRRKIRATHMDSGKWIRELREERFVKSSDIERISRSIADVKGNADFYVSHSTLADIETGSVPSIHKLFSLAACLKVSLEELLLVFGIDAERGTAVRRPVRSGTAPASDHHGSARARFPLSTQFRYRASTVTRPACSN